MENPSPPRSFRRFAAVLGLVGLSLMWLAWLTDGKPPSVHLAILVAAALVSENFALSLPVFNVSLAFPLIVAATVLDGPQGAAIVAAVSFTNWEEIRQRRPGSVLVFNFGQLVISACAGAWVYVWLGGTVALASGGVPLGIDDLPRSSVAILSAALATTLPNMLMTAYAAATLRGHRFMSAFLAMLAHAPTQLALAGVGLLLAQVMMIEAVAVPLFLLPLLQARGTYQRYEKLKGVYLDTVRSLIAALEAKDPYTKGHSERVADYSMLLGRHLGLEGGDVDRLGRAGLLHDIGKLSLSSAILTKPSALSARESAVMRRHPEIGASMVDRIPLLRELSVHVLCHHERPDGTGYPAGSFAPDIPRLSKILAVADAYDAMTTNRPYRPALSQEQALAEIVKESGSQFDPVVVRAFVEAIREQLGDSRGTALVGGRAASAVGAG